MTELPPTKPDSRPIYSGIKGIHDDQRLDWNSLEPALPQGRRHPHALPDAPPPAENSTITRMMTAEKLAELAGLLNRVAWMTGDLVVEIGTYHGVTAQFMAEVLYLMGAIVPVVSIDPFEGCPVPETPANPHGSYQGYRQTTADSEQCFCIAATSVQAAILIPKRIGLLLVDGYHSYEACLADLSLYVPKVISRGFVFVDDDDAGHPGVMRAISDYFAGKPNYDIRRNGSYAVIRKGDD